MRRSAPSQLSNADNKNDGDIGREVWGSETHGKVLGRLRRAPHICGRSESAPLIPVCVAIVSYSPSLSNNRNGKNVIVSSNERFLLKLTQYSFLLSRYELFPVYQSISLLYRHITEPVCYTFF